MANRCIKRRYNFLKIPKSLPKVFLEFNWFPSRLATIAEGGRYRDAAKRGREKERRRRGSERGIAWGPAKAAVRTEKGRDERERMGRREGARERERRRADTGAACLCLCFGKWLMTSRPDLLFCHPTRERTRERAPRRERTDTVEVSHCYLAALDDGQPWKMTIATKKYFTGGAFERRRYAPWAHTVCN